MARSPIAFRTCFETACLVVSEVIPDAASTAERVRLIDFNRAYEVGYGVAGADGWTDARVGATVTPTARLIGFDAIGDGRLFEVFDMDPRGDEDAVKLGFTENSAGILLNETATTVWMTWVPETVKFSNTSWAAEAHDFAVGDVRVNPATNHCYRCIEAHSTTTGSVFADDLTAAKWLLMPVLAVLEEFIYAYVQSLDLLRGGNAGTGYKMQQECLAALTSVAEIEIKNRLQN